MFYRSPNLDKEAEDKIQSLNAIYTKVEEIIVTLPESRAALFAQTNLDQSYMWAVKSVEDAMLVRLAQAATETPAKAPLEQPKAPMAAPAPIPVPPPAPAPVMPTIPVAAPAPAPIMPVIPVPPPTTDVEILAQSRVQLDSLMSGIKELTDTVKVSGFPIK